MGPQLFMNKQNCFDYIQFNYLSIDIQWQNKIRKESECILLFLIQKGYERQTSLEILLVNFQVNLHKLLRYINHRLLWQIGKIKMKYHKMQHFTRVCTVC